MKAIHEAIRYAGAESNFGRVQTIDPDYFVKLMEKTATANVSSAWTNEVFTVSTLANKVQLTPAMIKKAVPKKFDRQAVFNELYETQEETKEPNWDGEGAAAVTEETYRHAYRFLELLPSHIESPTVSADTDGHISLEWYRSPNKTISVSVSPERELHYAAIIGARRYHATEPLDSSGTPEILLSLVKRVVAA